MNKSDPAVKNSKFFVNYFEKNQRFYWNFVYFIFCNNKKSDLGNSPPPFSNTVVIWLVPKEKSTTKGLNIYF